MSNKKFYTSFLLILCVIAVIFCIPFWGKVVGSSFEFNTLEDINNTDFYNVYDLNNGDKLTVGNAKSSANMICIRFDNTGNVIWKKVFGIYESNSNLTFVKAFEKTDGSITIKGLFSNTQSTNNTACIELTLRSDGKLLETKKISDY